MQIHTLGFFPNSFESYYHQSLLGKAVSQGMVEFFFHQLRDWSSKAYGSVDDKPYGGSTGMLLSPAVACSAVRDLKQKHAIKKVVLTTPSGVLFNAKKAKELSQCDSLLFLCPRYEGIDQRAIDLVVDEEISIGDYVLSGGELASCVMIDAICRFLPGIVGKPSSVHQDSFEDGLLEAPQFTRPEIFENIQVPPVLLSGHHQEIAAWQRKESLRLTWKRRPDLLKKANLTTEEREFIMKLIHNVH